MAAQAALSKVHKTSLPSFAFVSPVGALDFVLVNFFCEILSARFQWNSWRHPGINEDGLAWSMVFIDGSRNGGQAI